MIGLGHIYIASSAFFLRILHTKILRRNTKKHKENNENHKQYCEFERPRVGLSAC